MAWFDSALESVGNGLISAGESCMEAGISVWTQSAQMVLDYCTLDPTSMGAWGTVKTIYNMFYGIGVSLVALYFVMGWLRESIDIKRNFTLENIFMFFIRFILTISVISGGMRLISEMLRLSALLANEIGMNINTNYQTDHIFANITEGLSGGDCFGIGILCLFGGIIGMLVIIVSSITMLVSVLKRFYKIFMCIPFAPVALASFAGGQGLSQSGISWIKTFLGYCLEIVIIAISLVISFKMSNGITFFTANDGWTGVILGICEICMPMIIAVGSVVGAEGIIRKTLGL